jgi:hypothetical protein
MMILLTAVDLGLGALFFGIFAGGQALMDVLACPRVTGPANESARPRPPRTQCLNSFPKEGGSFMRAQTRLVQEDGRRDQMYAQPLELDLEDSSRSVVEARKPRIRQPSAAHVQLLFQ